MMLACFGTYFYLVVLSEESMAIELECFILLMLIRFEGEQPWHSSLCPASIFDGMSFEPPES